MVASISQGAAGSTYALDPLDRVSVTGHTTSGTVLRETTDHYSSSNDSPAWTQTKTRPDGASAWTTKWTRWISGPGGGLAIEQKSDGDAALQLSNLHGDIISKIPIASTGGLTNYQESTEYGVPRTMPWPAATGPYGYVGQHQRSNDTAPGFTLMGSRLYNPTTGRFLTRDPVPGGNDNPYVYPVDPVNDRDLNGRWSYTRRYSLGYYAIAASTYFSWVRSHFTSLFPISGAKSLSQGRQMTLWPAHFAYFPVTVSQLTSTGWTFGVRKGHMDWPGGTIKFRFSRTGRGQMELEIYAYIPTMSGGGVCGRSMGCRSFYEWAASNTWGGFAQNLKAARRGSW
jgi:RHS repeat-associated protein